MSNQPNQIKILLVEDSSFYSKVLQNFLENLGVQVDSAQDFDNALAKILEKKYEIAIISISVGKNQGFELVPVFQNQNPGKEAILLAEEIVDRYIEEVIHLNVSNILSKPIKKDEFQILVNRILHKEERKKIFGLRNCLIRPEKIFSVEIRDSHSISRVLRQIFETAQKEGFTFTDEFIARLVLTEMLTNAIYHSHGFTREKLASQPVELPEGKKVDIHFGRDETRFGISVTDYMGILTRKKVLESISLISRQNSLLQNKSLQETDVIKEVQSHGRGIEIIRKFSGEYNYIIEKGVKTEGTIIFDSIFDKDAKHASLKIMEINKKNRD